MEVRWDVVCSKFHFSLSRFSIPTSANTQNKIFFGSTSVEPHLELTEKPIVVRVNTTSIFHPPLNISVSTCPHYPNDENLNIREESEADKLPIGEHQLRCQGLSALL